MKKILFLLLVLSYILISCNRGFTPSQAASRGGMKCGKHRLK
jgi:hypothetical protein